MGIKTLAVLIVLVGALGGVLYFTSEKPPIAESAQAPALEGRSLRDCKFFRWQFKNPEQQPFEVSRREDGSFAITEPVNDRASIGYVQQIVNAWDSANLIATDYTDDAAGHAETGLDEPVMVFAAEWPDGHRVEFEVGGQGPLGDDRFMKREGKTWLGGRGLYGSMRVNLHDLRDRQVFQLQETTCTQLDVQGLRVETGKRERIELKRSGRVWRLSEPVESRAHQASAIKFITLVLALRADHFIQGMVRVPDRDPDVVVVAKGSTGEERLELWIEQGAAFGQLPGRSSWFQCDPRTFESVFHHADESLRARTLIGVDDIATEVAGVVIDPGASKGRGDRIHLLRDSVATEWRLTEPVEYPAHATRANEAMQALNNLRAVEFLAGAKVDDPALGLGAGRMTLSVREFEEREAHTIWIGSEVDRNGLTLVHACRADEPGTIVLVPAPAVARLKREWPVYCQRDILKVPVPVGALEVRRADGTVVRQIARNDEGAWESEGLSAEAVQEAGEFIKDVLRDFGGKRAVDLRDGHPHGAPDYVLVLQRRNGEPLRELRAWDRDGKLPVIVQTEQMKEIGFEIGARDGRSMRELWK
ncbi:MAG: DUF4340 domain-containing protein [bacterium]|nr:DUF4340 domain-containing protein [bacterium]